jgi:hypothetical protein
VTSLTASGGSNSAPSSPQSIVGGY